MIPSIPQEGQPLDLQYISDLASSIIELNKNLTKNNSYSNTFVKNQDNNTKYDRTSNSSFYAVFEPIVENETVAPGHLRSFSYTFSHSFTHTPVVTVTAVNIGKTSQGNNVNVILTEVTPGSISGYMKFNNAKSGVASVGINIIAIGFQGSLTS
jgi:hypothetical protein